MASKKKRNLLRFGDLAAILLVAALAAALLWVFLTSDRGSAAQIVIDNETVATLSLSEDAVYPVTANGHRLTVRVENGEVFVTDADCPDKVCEHTGKIKAEGASVVCAAARVIVRVVGGGNSDADFVAG